MKLLLEIITPEKIIYKSEVDEIITNTMDGQIAILPNHVGLFTKITPGELTVRKGNKLEHLAITGGFLEITNNCVNILADYAVRAEDIEVTKAQEAQKRAERLMKEKASEKEIKIAEAELQKALLELNVAKRHKRRQTISPTN